MSSTEATVVQRLTRLDKSLTQKIHSKTTPIIPTPFLKLLELTGDGRLWFPISLSLLLSSHFSLSLLLGLISDIIIVGLLKHFFRRPRPRHNTHPMGPTFAVDHWSFPSGHASRTCFLAAFFHLSYHRLDQEIVSRWILVCVWVWALMTSVSRVFMGRHYVFDVLVGVFVGLLNAIFVETVFSYGIL